MAHNSRQEISLRSGGVARNESCIVSRGLVTVLETLENVLRTMNEYKYEETFLFQPTWLPALDRSRSTTSNRPRMRLRTPLDAGDAARAPV